jgi:hypothetical protein
MFTFLCYLTLLGDYSAAIRFKAIFASFIVKFNIVDIKKIYFWSCSQFLVPVNQKCCFKVFPVWYFSIYKKGCKIKIFTFLIKKVIVKVLFAVNLSPWTTLTLEWPWPSRFYIRNELPVSREHGSCVRLMHTGLYSLFHSSRTGGV